LCGNHGGFFSIFTAFYGKFLLKTHLKARSCQHPDRHKRNGNFCTERLQEEEVEKQKMDKKFQDSPLKINFRD